MFTLGAPLLFFEFIYIVRREIARTTKGTYNRSLPSDGMIGAIVSLGGMMIALCVFLHLFVIKELPFLDADLAQHIGGWTPLVGLLLNPFFTVSCISLYYAYLSAKDSRKLDDKGVPVRPSEIHRVVTFQRRGIPRTEVVYSFLEDYRGSMELPMWENSAIFVNHSAVSTDYNLNIPVHHHINKGPADQFVVVYLPENPNIHRIYQDPEPDKPLTMEEE